MNKDMFVDLNIEQLRKDTEYAFAVIAGTYWFEGERNGLLLAGADNKKLAEYDAVMARKEKEC